MYYLGLDVGGTNLAAGIVDENCRIVSKKSCPSGADRPAQAILDDMVRISESVVYESGLAMDEVASWGIGMPSCVNPRTGLLVHANCFGWKNFDIYAGLEDRLPLPLYIENDANCAALGETLGGGAKGCKNVLLLTLGTGVGSGIIIDGKIFAGADMMGAELGHTKFTYPGRLCTCGQHGCTDVYCSATALVRLAREKLEAFPGSPLYQAVMEDGKTLNAKLIFDAGRIGDRLAREALDEYIDHLSYAISTFIAIFRPEIVILGGGVANAGEELLVPLRERVLENTFSAEQIGVPPIQSAALGNDAGIVGAAFLCKYGLNRRAGVNRISEKFYTRSERDGEKKRIVGQDEGRADCLVSGTA